MRIFAVLCLAVIGCGSSKPAMTPPPPLSAQEALTRNSLVFESILQTLASSEWTDLERNVERWESNQSEIISQFPPEVSGTPNPVREDILKLFGTEKPFISTISSATAAIRKLQESLGDNTMTVGTKLERYETTINQLAELEKQFTAWGTAETTALGVLKEKGLTVNPLYPKYQPKTGARIKNLKGELENLEATMRKILGLPKTNP